MRKTKFALSFLLILLCFSLAYQVQAGGLLDTVKEGGLDTIGDDAYNQSGDPTDIRVIVARMINILLGFLGIIFTVLVVYAGYQWMTSGGDSSKIGEAKKRVTAGVIGLIIILASWGVSTYVTGCVWQVTSDTGNWICPGH
ncbi:hypothetical protein HGA34_02860 [Candidatus Falkowbacteria bacterium]|nr:hypothetical protein [Candidatus Falkowbacteria bacterium]